jgi:hypothetical protein
MMCEAPETIINHYACDFSIRRPVGAERDLCRSILRFFIFTYEYVIGRTPRKSNPIANAKRRAYVVRRSFVFELTSVQPLAEAYREFPF